MRAHVLTISDSGFAGTREDVSGPKVAERLRELGWHIEAPEILPDDRGRIASRLREIADQPEGVAIFTTGGTGVSARDNTPEATKDVLEKEMPGLGEKMRAEGLKKTHLAVLSRATAGTRGRSLIVNLPGSPKGALESLNAIVDLAPPISSIYWLGRQNIFLGRNGIGD